MIGNDIIDWQDWRTDRAERRWKKFLTSAECGWLDQQPNQGQWAAAFWAAKESCVKAADSATFSPKQMEVRVQSMVAFTVEYGHLKFTGRWKWTPEYLFAECWLATEQPPSETLIIRTESARDQNASQQIRTAVGNHLELEGGNWSKTELGRPLWKRNSLALPYLFSFTHHGNFAAASLYKNLLVRSYLNLTLRFYYGLFSATLRSRNPHLAMAKLRFRCLD